MDDSWSSTTGTVLHCWTVLNCIELNWTVYWTDCLYSTVPTVLQLSSCDRSAVVNCTELYCDCTVTVLHCTVLLCTVLWLYCGHCTDCTVLHCTTLYCTRRCTHCTALHCTELHWTALNCTELYCNCTVLYCTVLFNCTILGTAYCTATGTQLYWDCTAYCTQLLTVLNCTVPSVLYCTVLYCTFHTHIL